MLAKVTTCAVVGLEGAIVEVEVDISPGLPSFTIVGLPDAAVQEAKERVRAAIRNSGCTFPMKRIVVNLAPAHLKKAGPAYDLPIAVGILLSSEQVSADVSQHILLGELSLDGILRHTNGILPMVALAHQEKLSTIIVPEVDAQEASLIDGTKILPFASLPQLVSYFRGEIPAPEYKAEPAKEYTQYTLPPTDLAYIKGQEHVKRALEVAAAGGHNIIMMGPPGSGKTLLARSLPSLLPPMTNAEALEVTKIYSVSGLLPANTPLLRERPFRSPHYTISHAGLVGGGHWPKPGEISLSHRGVLFLDELPEFGHSVLEVLRQPLEDRVITISRAQGWLMMTAITHLITACDISGSTVSSLVGQGYSIHLSGFIVFRIRNGFDTPERAGVALSRNGRNTLQNAIVINSQIISRDPKCTGSNPDNNDQFQIIGVHSPDYIIVRTLSYSPDVDY
jgi:magnesium chelatase family protein